MKKVVSITVKNFLGSSEKASTKYKFLEYEELNELLNDGWKIKNVDYISSNISAYFSAVYTLEK